MELLLTSDTHLRRGGSRVLPDVLWAAIDAADVVVHAGDWMDPGLLDELEARAARLVACWGNNDGTELRARLPETAVADVGACGSPSPTRPGQRPAGSDGATHASARSRPCRSTSSSSGTATSPGTA